MVEWKMGQVCRICAARMARELEARGLTRTLDDETPEYVPAKGTHVAGRVFDVDLGPEAMLGELRYRFRTQHQTTKLAEDEIAELL